MADLINEKVSTFKFLQEKKPVEILEEFENELDVIKMVRRLRDVDALKRILLSPA